MLDQIKVGTILENGVRQFAKVISIKNGMYGLTNWNKLDIVKNDKVAMKFINSFGILAGNLKVVKAKK